MTQGAGRFETDWVRLFDAMRERDVQRIGLLLHGVDALAFRAMSLLPDRTTSRSIPCASILTISTRWGMRARRLAIATTQTERRSRTWLHQGPKPALIETFRREEQPARPPTLNVRNSPSGMDVGDTAMGRMMPLAW